MAPSRGNALLLNQVMDTDNVDVREVPKAGRGLLANGAIDLRTPVTSANHITIKALSNARLKNTCYHCQDGRGDAANLPESGGQDSNPLKLCSGCKTVRYCSTKCQKTSWSEIHQHECKIFRGLAPRVLPGNVRAVMRLLLLHKVGKLMPGEWDETLALNDHLKQFQEAGGEIWQDLYLSAKATKTYSGTEVDELIVVRLLGILMTNSFTLTTPTYDPIGVALHPFTALINHSCEYNATIRFSKDGRTVEVVPLRPIKIGEEITISYIDELLPFKERQAELKDRYFFTCTCSRCARETSAPTSHFSQSALSPYDSAAILLSSKDPSIMSLTSALSTLRHHDCSATIYPLPSLRQTLITSYLSRNQHSLAFTYAMMQSFQLDPTLYPQPHHPIRMVHGWLCVRIIDHMLDVGTTTEKDIAIGTIDLDFWRRVIVVSLYRSVNAGPVGDFGKTVQQRYREDRESWAVGATAFGNIFDSRNAGGNSDGMYQGMFSGKSVLAEEWVGVQTVIDDVLRRERDR